MNTTPVFLIGDVRTGTHMLRSILTVGFSASDYGEIFDADGGDKEKGYFSFYLNRVKENIEESIPRQMTQEILFDLYVKNILNKEEAAVSIFDVKYGQSNILNPLFYYPDRMPFLLSLIMKNDFKIIHLIRRNVVEARLSAFLAVRTGNWVNYDWQEKLNNEQGISVDVKLFKEDITQSLIRILRFSEYFKTYPKAIKINYEDLIEDGELCQDQAAILADFLELPVPERVKPTTRKISGNIWDRINNCDEIVAALKGTPFESMVPS